MTRGRERRPAWAGVATFVVLAAAWYALTTLTHTIGGGRFPSPAEAWDALRQIAIVGYADARSRRARPAQRQAGDAGLRGSGNRRRAARARDGREPRVRGVRQPGVPADPADPAARVDSARDRLARSGRRGEGVDHLVRRVRAGRDQQLQRRARDRAVSHRGRADARRAALDVRTRGADSRARCR